MREHGTPVVYIEYYAYRVERRCGMWPVCVYSGLRKFDFLRPKKHLASLTELFKRWKEGCNRSDSGKQRMSRAACTA